MKKSAFFLIIVVGLSFFSCVGNNQQDCDNCYQDSTKVVDTVVVAPSEDTVLLTVDTTNTFVRPPVEK